MKDAYITTTVVFDIELDENGYEIEGDEYLLIERLWVPSDKRGSGVGSDLINDAKLEADDLGLRLRVAALPFDSDMDIETLVRWYEDRGFSVESTAGDAVVLVY